MWRFTHWYHVLLTKLSFPIFFLILISTFVCLDITNTILYNIVVCVKISFLTYPWIPCFTSVLSIALYLQDLNQKVIYFCQLWHIYNMQTFIVYWVWWKEEILCLERKLKPHFWPSRTVCYHYITPCRLRDVTTIPMSTCLCSSLHQRSVQTTTLVI